MKPDPVLYVVHCIDTEGPLTEDIGDTFDRLNRIFGVSIEPSRKNLEALQRQEIKLNGIEGEVARMIAPHLLRYNSAWADIQEMLDDCLSEAFRKQLPDDSGQGWVYSWHCMDHAGYSSNPRRKDVGYGNVFQFYQRALAESRSQRDEINWHFHPLSFSRNPLQCATSYVNTYDVLMQVLCRRVIEARWFPVVNRPGFHSERPDSHAFLEQWIPYDYANQYYETAEGQPDLSDGRFGDWRRAPATWRGYHPSHDDFQTPGACRRWIFRCLNVGTRLRELGAAHVAQAFSEARDTGSAILAFADHDYRDIRPDVERVRSLVAEVKRDYPGVKVRYAGAAEAARAHTTRLSGQFQEQLKLSLRRDGKRIFVETIAGRVFGPQPFLAIRTLDGQYWHDNLDLQEPGRVWSYTFDDQTLLPEQVDRVGVASVGLCGFADVRVEKWGIE